MVVFETCNLGLCYPKIINEIRNYGDTVNIHGEFVKEVCPLIVHLAKPYNCVVARKGFNEALMWMDIVQVLAGTFDPELYNLVSPNAAQHLTASGAYGPRVIPQLLAVRNLLQTRSYTRRAVIYLGKQDEFYSPKPGGMPCTMGWQFIRRNDSLYMINHMRANDVVWGLSYDIPTAIAVGLTLAADLQITLSKYIHFAGVGELYFQHWDLYPKSKITAPLNYRITSGYKLEDIILTASDMLIQLRNGKFNATDPLWESAAKSWQQKLK